MLCTFFGGFFVGWLGSGFLLGVFRTPTATAHGLSFLIGLGTGGLACLAGCSFDEPAISALTPIAARHVPAPVAATAANADGCNPSYPTICIPADSPELDCKDIPHRRFTVLAPDPHHFDNNGDGVGCEK